MDARPRVLIIGARGIGGSEGGVEKFAEEFVRRIARSCRVTLLSLPGPAPADIGDVELLMTRRSRLMRTDKLYYYLAGARVCLMRRFSHVILLGLNSAMLLLPLRLLFWRRVNVVVRSGSVDYLLEKWGSIAKLYFKLAEGLLMLADVVVAVAPSVQRHLAGRGIPSVVIPNGLSRAANPCPVAGRRERHVVAVGRVTAQKNYRLLIEAARLLRDRGVSVSIIGGADLSDESSRLRSLVEQGGCDNVAFMGALDRALVMERVAAAALYVNCSVHEGMSNSVLEAIQLGTPILLSDIDANRDLDLADSFYFDPKSPADLARKIETALARPSDFLVDPARFRSWDDVVETYRSHMNLPGGPT